MFVRQKINLSGCFSVKIAQRVGRINKVVRTIGCVTATDELEKFQK